MGPVGQRGEPGPAGASVIDVSQLLLNGNKDEPQPSNAYTTLFS